MGCGSWTTSSFASYSTSTKGATLDNLGMLRGMSDSTQDVYKQSKIHADLNPHNVMRECCDNEEHPNTVPVILALDVTGSMGSTAIEVAKSLNVIMTKLYDQVPDVEFCIMGIGDLAYDNAPIQISQFESDVRIAEHLDKIYFEGGGGGNSFESYTAAWYMGLNHTRLDCWKRGKRGIIITMGDEELNPYLGSRTLGYVTGDDLQGDVETCNLYKDVSEKFDVYHINVMHGYRNDAYAKSFRKTFVSVIGDDHFFSSDLNALPDVITKIIVDNQKEQNGEQQKEEPITVGIASGEGISW